DLPRFVGELQARGLLVSPSARPIRALAPDDAPRGGGYRSGDQLVLATPVVFRLGPGGFEQLDYDGRVRARMSALELLAASEFRRPLTSAQAWAGHRQSAGPRHLDERSFAALVGRLVGAESLQRYDADDALRQRSLSREERDIRRAMI